MCPSYQATREELHSTRGRAHLLWEMLEGDLVTDGWRSTEVRDALDLCLSCKGCLLGLPRERRHGDLQGRVHPSPLRRPALGAAALALVDGLAALVVALRVEGAAAGQPDGADARWRSGWAGSRRSARFPSSPSRPSPPGSPAAPPRSWPSPEAASCCGRTPSPTIWRPRWVEPRSRCSRPPDTRWCSPQGRCAAG